MICLVGNKVDLKDEREVDELEVADYVEELNQEQTSTGAPAGKVILAECSAKSGDGVLETFNVIARALPIEDAVGGARNRQLRNKRSSGVDLSRGRQQQQLQAASGCC